jgi:hypothetical protein
MPPTGRKPKRTPRIKRTDPAYSAKFIKAVKELGIGEESGDAFERAINALTKRKKSQSS